MGHLEYLLAVALLLVGLAGMAIPRHLLRKLMAMNVLQVAVIVFFIAAAAKRGAAPPIAVEASPPAAGYVNPLPHALMLTAIVVGVSTTGLALALLVRIHQRYRTLDEEELIDRMRR